MKIDGRLSIASVAAEIPGATTVFESLGIDYSCAGNRSLDDAAHAEGIDPELVLDRLRRLADGARPEPWPDRSLASLVRYLAARHHLLVHDQMAGIALHLADACSPAPALPDLQSLREAFIRLSGIVLPHLNREEHEVFREIEALESAWQSSEAEAARGGLSDRIQELTIEHGAIADQLRTIRDLRLGLALLPDLPGQGRHALEDLATLEAHVHESMFLENTILFPRAMALEGQKVGAAQGR